jgi:hypothetical protein
MVPDAEPFIPAGQSDICILLGVFGNWVTLPFLVLDA